jgi:hypothetical protein
MSCAYVVYSSVLMSCRKTEATKQCLNYIAEVAGSSTGVHHRILQANPILEGWGNAKTLRNNNSSRFGKFIELLICASNGEIVGSSNTTYLLEKSRVVFQEEGERNYHVFYQLLFGAPNELIHEFNLDHMRAHPNDVMCINQSGCMFIDGVDDQKDYEEINDAQRDIGFHSGDYKVLLQAVAGIIHLRNIEFVEDSEDSEGASITSHPEDYITKAGQLFGLEMESFTRSLLFKSVRGGGRRTSVSFKKYTPEVAIENRNALAKEIYRRCFDYIVAKINSSINAKPEELSKMQTSMIGILDIFGFEIFKKNSFEQLCINLANEALQKHFNTNIFEMEMNIYTAEDILIPDLSYKDNEDVLELVIQKPKGLIPLLDEEGQVPRGSWEGFLRKFTTHHVKSPRLKFRQGLQVFTIVHYAGDVAYDPSLFIVKNKDTLSADLSEAMRLSSVPLIEELFAEKETPAQQVAASPTNRRSSSVAAKQTVGTNFRVQLDHLIANLNTTAPKYIRCIKPNAEKKPNLFDSALTNEQLTYSGVFEAVMIMQNGYPFRLGLWAFKERYHMLVDYKSCCEAVSGDNDDRDKLMTFVELLKGVDAEFSLCHVGKTMVFYRVAQHRLLEKMRKDIVGRARSLIQKQGKAFVAKNLYQQILAEKKRCGELILARKAEEMKASADILTDLKERVNVTFPDSDVPVDPCAMVAYDYADAIELELQVNAELEDLMDPSRNVFEVFDMLVQCIERAKALEFSVTFQSQVLSIEWQKNEVISMAIEKVIKYENIIAIKTNLESSLADCNDIELEIWLKKLEVARNSGQVDDTFCAVESVKGTKIVQAAQREFDDLVSDVDDAILKGKFAYKLDATMDNKASFERFIHFQSEVDASLLTAFLTAFDEKFANKKQSVKLQRLVDLCRKLAALRLAAKGNRWSSVSTLLPVWRLYAKESPNYKASSDVDVDDRDEEPVELLAIVPEFKKSISKEIQALYDCSVSCLQFPDIIAELNQVTIPDTFQLQKSSSGATSSSPSSFRVEGLIASLTSSEELHFLSDEHQHAVRNISERILIRRLIACQLQEDLRDYLAPTTSRTLPSADIDMLSAQKWLNFFDICGELWTSVLEGVPIGAPGTLDCAGFSASRLRSALKHCVTLEVQPLEQWEEITDHCNRLLQVWTCLQNNEWQEALVMIESVVRDYPEALSECEDSHQDENTAVILETFHSDIMSLAKREYARYHREIISHLALVELTGSIVSGAVSGEVGCLNIDFVSTDALESSLASIQGKVIMTAAVTQLMDDCYVLIRLRQAVKASEWDALLDDTAELYDKSDGFSTTHPCLLEEFETIHGEAQDLQARQKISDVLLVSVLSVLPTGEVLAGRDLTASITSLNSAIDFCLSQKTLSLEANLLLSSAILICTARQSLVQSLWEDESFGLQGVETADLSIEHFADCSDSKRLALLASLLKPQKILYADELDARHVSAGAGAPAAMCMDKLLAHARSVEIHEFASEEIGVLRRAATERRCRLVLILALSTNQISGLVEKINTSDVSIEHLLRGIEFVKLCASQLSKSFHVWIEGALFVLNFRIVVGSVDVASLTGLATYFSEEYLHKCKELLAITSPSKEEREEGDSRTAKLPVASGFPVAELQLVVDYINDCLNFNSLVEAMNLGRVQFYENKFDTQIVSFSHLLSAIAVTKKHATRSDRLDRLMFYAELCVFLRQALLSENWEASSQGKSKRGASVRQCLVDYQEANVFFKVPMENVPPPFLKDEFHITKRELERQTILLGFSSAFQSGRIGGMNGCLQLHDIMYQRLTDQVDKSKAWAESSGIKDFDLDLCVSAAEELIQVRKRVSEVHNKYKSDIKFPKPSNSLRTVIQSGFISDAINHAASRVEGLGKYPFVFNTEWARVEQALSKMKVSGRLRSTRQQVELLSAETFQRNFCGNVLHVLQGLQTKTTGQLSSRKSLNAASFLYGWCRSYAIHRTEMDKQSNNSIKPDATTELLYKSSVALTHLLRAEANNQYDDFERTWLDGDTSRPFLSSSVSEKSDYTLPPTFYTLVLHIDKTEHSVQSILRSISKWQKLHPAVKQQIRRAIRHVEDEVTATELSVSLQEGKVTGSVGNINYSSIFLSSIRTALERALDFLSQDGVCVHTKQNMHSERNSNGRFRFSSTFSSNEIAHIEQQVGLQKTYGQNSYMKIVYCEGSDDALSSSSRTANSETIPRSDLIKLRHTCELIYELREAIRTKNFSSAYEIICDNIGEPNQSFKELIDTIYAGNFSLHFLGVEEFSLMVFEVCENYCLQKARDVLVSNPIAGARTALNLFSVHQVSYRAAMQDVMCMVEGLVEVSPASVHLREICFLINHMRELVIDGSLYKDQEMKIAKKRDIQVPAQPTADVQALMKQPFLKDAMNNAFANVKVISPDSKKLNGLDYNRILTMLAIADKVETVLLETSVEILVKHHQDTLLVECRLVKEYCKWHAGILSLQRVLYIDMVWYSFSTGRLESDPNMRTLVESTVKDAKQLNMNTTLPAEKLILDFFEIAEKFCSVLKVTSIAGCGYESEEDDDKTDDHFLCDVGSDYFSDHVRAHMLALINAVDAYTSSKAQVLLMLSPSFLKQIAEIQKVVDDHDHYLMLLQTISDPAHFVIGRLDTQSEATIMSPLLIGDYPDPKPNDSLGELKKIEMFSLKGNRLKSIVLLQLQLRNAILTEQFGKAEELCQNLAIVNLLELKNTEFTLMSELCSTMMMKRQLEQGIISCILPPVAGWSNFTTAPSLALSIVDFPLREAIQTLRALQHTHTVLDGGDDGSEEDEDEVNPLLDELGNIGSLMLSVIGAIRRQVWNKLDLMGGNASDSMAVSKERFLKLFPKDLFTDVKEETSKLEDVFDDVFLCDEGQQSVLNTLTTIQKQTTKIQFMSSALREFVEYFISSVQIEQHIFELSNNAMAAISEQKINGMPGCVQCTEESVQILGSAYDRITNSRRSVESSPGLKRILQSLKLLKLARLAIFENNWSALGPILDLYVYMRSLDKFDAEKNCADLMYYEILDGKTLLKLSHSEFEHVISETIDNFKANVDNNKVNALVGIVNDPPTQDIRGHAQVLLGVDSYSDLLQSIPELETEMKLLNNHYLFEKAGHIFNLALTTTPAHGMPGDLNTDDLRFDFFHEVSEILLDNGLLSYPSGKHLHLCSLAIVELRMGQRGKRLNDIKSSLTKLNAMCDEEANGSGVRYLVKAFAEFDLARVDLEQQELAQFMMEGLLENQLPSGNIRLDLCSGKAYMDKLAHILKESMKRKITSKRCRILFKSIQLLMSLWEHLHTKSWDALKETIGMFGMNDKNEYDELMTTEVECAQRLMDVSGALDVAEEGIHTGCIAGSIGDIDVADVSTAKLEEAKEAFLLVKSEWRTALISSYNTSCAVLISVRECAVKREWSKVLDLCTLALAKHTSHFPMIDSAYEEVMLAKEHATFVVIEGALVDALMNGRMDGDVGEIRATSVSTQFVTDALSYIAAFDQSVIMAHPRLAVLRDTAQLVYDLRKAQLSDTWMLDPSRVDRADKRLLPDPDTMAVTMSLVPLNWLASAGGNIMKNIGMTGLSALMKKYLGSSQHLEDALKQASLEVRTEIGEAGWLLQCNAIDNGGDDHDHAVTISSSSGDGDNNLDDDEEDVEDDAISKECVTETVTGTEMITVEDVLSRARELESTTGIAPEAFLELAFAREEINHRHIVQMLLGAMTSQGFVGQAGKLDGSSMDLHPLERAIFFAENDIDNSDRGKCKWMLRDAKLLFKARKFRVEKRWPELNAVLLEVTNTNMGKLSTTKKLDEAGNVVIPRLILPFAWKEISLIQADMHFYTCLSEFAQEMTSRAGKSQVRSRRKGLEGKSLTGLLRVLLRTLSAAELHPSMEFDRLLEAENVALELRTHMTFDSQVSPREVILKVLNIRERDKRNHVPSYVCLLMPDISRLSDVLDTEQLVESLETSITKGQNYLRAALGFIDSADIDLEGMRSSLHTAMPLLNLTGSKEHLSLLSVATTILAIRVEVVAMNWRRVAELLEKHDSLLLSHEAILSEEISRLNIEIENDIACKDIEKSLQLGRSNDVYELVNKLSTQRRSSVNTTPLLGGAPRPIRAKGRASVSLTPQQINAMLSKSSDQDSLPELDKSIENAMQVRNRSTTTTTMLRAAVLIRSLRAAIQTGNWEEVQAILDEESSYMRFPQICQDEIKEVKAAMSYRTCMTVLSKGLINGATVGMPGEINISNIDCIPLEDAMKQTKTLEIFDPATSMLLEIGAYVGDLRRAVLAGRWFKPSDSGEGAFVEDEKEDVDDDFVDNVSKNVQFFDDNKEESEIVQNSTLFGGGVTQNSVPFGNGSSSSEGAINMGMNVINEDEEEEEDSDEEEGESYEDSNYNKVADEGVTEEKTDTTDDDDIEFGPDCSVEELLTVKERRVMTTHELKNILADRTSKREVTDRVPEWIEVQLKAIDSVGKELCLLQADLNERRRVDILVAILEVVPQPTREFNQIENAPSLKRKKKKQGSIYEDSSDIYLIKPLQLAIAKAQSIPGEMMKETTRIFNTAELILCFRKTMKSMEIENFKELLTRAKDYSGQGKLSLHYGLYELNSYRSATMTVTLTKAELLKSLESGRVAGPLHKLNIEEVETEALDFWVTSCAELMGMSQELMVGLLDAYQEAKVMLELRKSVVADKWEEVDDKLDKYFDQLYKFEFGAVELKHIQYASKYRIVESSIAEILDDEIPSDSSNLPAYIMPKMEPLEKALIYGQRIIDYQAQHLHRNVDVVPLKGKVADSYEFERICQNAKNVFKLWKSILSKSWQEEIIASGQVHLLPKTNDLLLNVYFESVRQHEVSQRLNLVHEQLAVLQLTGEKAVKNLRSSVRMSISVMNSRGAMDGFKESEDTEAGPYAMKSPVDKDKKNSVRSSLSMHAPQSVQTFEEKQNETKTRALPSPQASASTAPKPQNEAIQDMLKARRTSHQRRKSSIGGMISNLLGNDLKPKPAKKKKSQHRNLSVVLDRQVSFADVPSVASVICEQDWTTLSTLALVHFEHARNLLINKVSLLRVKWGCKEGCATETADGNVSLADLSVELLEVALADCRRISFYSQQAHSRFSFSDEVETLIQLANILSNIRSIIMANRIDELMNQLRLFEDLSERHDMNLTLSKFPDIEKELRLFEKFSHEYVAEKVLNNALVYLASLPLVDSKTAGHSSITEVNNLDKKNRSIGEMTHTYCTTVQIAKLLRQSLISSVMCNQYALRELEGSIFRLVGVPGSSFNNSKKMISKIFAVLRKCSSIRFVADRKESNSSDQSVVSRRMSVQVISTFQPQAEKSFATMYGALDNIDKNEYFDENKADDMKYINYSIDSTAPNDKLSRMKSLPHLLMSIIQRVRPLEAPPSDVFFDSAMYLIPKAEVEDIENIYSDVEFLFSNIWLPANEGLMFDPLWLLAGQSILADIRSANKLLSLSAQAVPASSNGDDRNVKALAGVILHSHELLHQASYDFLLAAKKKSDRVSKRVNSTAGLEINLSDISILINTLDSSVKNAQEQIAISQRESIHKVPVSLYGRNKKALITLTRPADTFDRIILDFQERITVPLSRPSTDTIDVRFDQERYKKRLSTTCVKLLQLQGAASAAVVDSRRRDVRHAVMKRRRQFLQSPVV